MRPSAYINSQRLFSKNRWSSSLSASLIARIVCCVHLSSIPVCPLAANRGSNCSLTRAMDGRIVRCGIISSCQSASTSAIVKRFWSRTHVRSAITSIATFNFTFRRRLFPEAEGDGCVETSLVYRQLLTSS